MSPVICQEGTAMSQQYTDNVHNSPVVTGTIEWPTIKNTRVTLFDLMDHLKQGLPLYFAAHWYHLTSEEMDEVMQLRLAECRHIPALPSSPDSPEQKVYGSTSTLERGCHVTGPSFSKIFRNATPGDAWHNFNRTKPVEVVSERKSLLKMKLVDQHHTGTVCKTPRFIGKLAAGVPTQQDVGFCEVVNSSQCSGKNCSPMAIARNVCPRAFKRVRVSSTM